MLFLPPGCKSSASHLSSKHGDKRQWSFKENKEDCFSARNYGCWERILGVGKKRGDYEFQHIGGERVEKFGRCFLFPLRPFFRPFTRLNSVLLSFVSVFELLGSLIEWILHEFSSIDICLHLSRPLKLLVRTSSCVSAPLLY